jgi:glycosyltransferase involved in cell wall biosynthesis
MAKKLLFLSPQLPYPPFSGGVIKSWKLIEFLSKEYEVYAAYFLKNEDSLHEADFLSKVKLKAHYSEKLEVPRTALNFIKSNLKGIPLNLYRNLSTTFARKVEDLAKECEVILIDHYEVFQYVPKNYKGRVILHQHNCEYLMWDRFAKVEPKFAKRMALKNQAWRIKNYERKICNQSDVVLAAPNDIYELLLIGATETKYLETYHLGDEVLLSSPPLQFETTEIALLFVGTLTWEANVDGLVWFLEQGWQPLKQKFPELKLYIIGKNPDNRIVVLKEKLGADVVLTGFVEDLEPYFQKCRAFISPLRFGSGIKVKVMNAMYRGIPTITTSVGSEGLAIKTSHHLMVNDDMESYVKSVATVLTDKDKWEELSTASRQLANEKYTWDSVLNIVKRAIEG